MIRELIDDYVEVNKLKICFYNNKLQVFYYGSIDKVTDSNIIISKEGKIINIKGKGIIIESLFKEYVTISGKISFVGFEGFYE